MARLARKVALITGGASGLGSAIAHRFDSESATVVISDVQTDLGERTAADCNALFLEQDVRDELRWTEIIREIERRFGRLDILVNNAGIFGSGKTVSPEETRLADWRTIFAVNVEGVFLGCRAAIAAMRRNHGGCIINISSVAGLLATPFATAYGASKAAVAQLTKSVAQYCAEQRLNIRCNSVHPGDVRTPLWDRSVEEAAKLRGTSLDEVIATEKAHCPLGEFALPDDIAAAVAFLASDEARYMTGAKLIVDCGLVGCDTYRAPNS